MLDHLINLDRSPERLAEFMRWNGFLPDMRRVPTVEWAGALARGGGGKWPLRYSNGAGRAGNRRSCYREASQGALREQWLGLVRVNGQGLGEPAELVAGEVSVALLLGVPLEPPAGDRRAAHCCPVKPGSPARNGMILNGVLSI
jgi:hypothetical protein